MMSNARRNSVRRVLSGQALTDAMQNFAAVRQLVAAGQPVPICDGGDESNPLNENSDHPAEAGWRADSLPDELGRLNPPEDWQQERKVTILIVNSVVQRDAKGKPIRDFRFLPRFLSSDLPGKKIEAYFHRDSRIRYEDLWARMPNGTPPLTRAVKNHKYNNKRIREVRGPYHIPCFTPRRSTVTRTDVEIAATLTRSMIRQATVWPVTPQGIQDPSNPTRYLPLGSFLEPGTQIELGGERTWKAMYMLSVLNVVARVRQAPGDYKTLDKKYLPKSWNNRLSKSRAVPETGSDSDDEGSEEPSVGNISPDLPDVPGTSTKTGPALLSSDLFEQAARLREDRNPLTQQEQTGRQRSSQYNRPSINSLSHSAHRTGRQDLHGWVYGNHGDTFQQHGLVDHDQSQEQRPDTVQPPSHGLPGLQMYDEDVVSSKYAPVDLEDFDESNPFRISDLL